MNQLAAICNSPENAQRVHGQLKGLFDIQCVSPDRLDEAQPPGRYTVVVANLNDLDRVRGLRHWLTQKPKDGKVIFVTDKGSRLDRVRAWAIGATDFLHPPVDTTALLTKLYGDFQPRCVAGRNFAMPRRLQSLPLSNPCRRHSRWPGSGRRSIRR